jgi:hypothetical protein
LNAGLWFRRGRLAMVFSALAASCRRCAENPLIPAVQFPAATSDMPRVVVREAPASSTLRPAVSRAHMSMSRFTLMVIVGFAAFSKQGRRDVHVPRQSLEAVSPSVIGLDPWVADARSFPNPLAHLLRDIPCACYGVVVLQLRQAE